MNCLFPYGEFFNVVFRQRLPLCSSEPQSAEAASFGSSILFGQPLCSESRQFVLIHFGRLCRIPQNEELAVCRTVLSQNKAHFPGQQLPSMATTAGLLDEAKPNFDGSTFRSRFTVRAG
jgi:hypothetical protein